MICPKCKRKLLFKYSPKTTTSYCDYCGIIQIIDVSYLEPIIYPPMIKEERNG